VTELMGDCNSIALTPWNMIFGPKLFRMGILPQHKRLLTRVKKFRQKCYSIVQEHKTLYYENSNRKSQETKELNNENKKGDKPNLLHLLFSAQNNKEGDFLSDWEIVDQFITFFAAGMDTTAHVLTMMLYYLSLYPEYLEKIKDEISRVYDYEHITLEALNKMEFTSLFIKEVLRMATPAGLIYREAVADHYLQDFKIKKGTLLVVEPSCTNHNPKYFEDPEKFRVERWSEVGVMGLDPFCFTPFSAGPRVCLGQHLANNELKIVLCEFLKRFEFKVVEGYILKMSLRFMYEPLDPVRLVLRKRKFD